MKTTTCWQPRRVIPDRRWKQEQFWLLERLASFFYSIGITATQDILEAIEIPSSLVLLAAAGPACLISVLYPYFFQRIPVLVASCVIFTLSITGMLLTALAQWSAQLKVKLIGVCILPLGVGSTEMVFYPLSAFYGGSTVNSYASGSGISCLVAPLSYAGKHNILLLRVLKFGITQSYIEFLWFSPNPDVRRKCHFL